MREAVSAFDHPEMDIVHPELLDEQTGLVFYEHMMAGEKYFGKAIVVKNWFGWHLVRSGSGQIPESYVFMKGFPTWSRQLVLIQICLVKKSSTRV